MDCFNHTPLLLVLSTEPWAQLRFHFESFWPTVDGFLNVVTNAWTCPLDVDACRALDHKLRSVARALKGWSAQGIGSVRFQLAVARVVIFKLDVTQETRLLLTVINHQLYKSIRIKRRVKMSFTLDLGVLN
jgi:hypothetical protein